MFNLMIILLSTINTEPIDSNNYKIAKYVIENISTLENCTLTELAKKCYVSNSSISRFCTEIGFDDFNSFKTQLVKLPYERIKAQKKFDFEQYDNESISKSYVLSVIDNLNHLNDASLDKDIDDLVKDIHQYKNVATFGSLQSETIALSLQFDLQTSGKIIHTHLKFKDQVDFFHHADESWLVIIFSKTGNYFNRSFQRIKPFEKMQHKPKIYVITSNPTVSEPYVDRYIRYTSRNDYASHPYPMMVIANLICLHYAHTYLENKE